jgi:hypothetical protein
VLAVFKHSCTFTYETPGVGTTDPKRNSAMIESVKKILRRKSGVLNALPNADNKIFSF